MKFKFIFIVFNCIIIISFLFIFLMPFFILGWEYTQVFWSGNWYLGVLFLLILVALNTYFLLNWNLFSLLEKEDWQKLGLFLEQQVYEKKRLRKQYVRLLINTYVVQSQTDKIEKLEKYIRETKTKFMQDFALQFGLPYLLKSDAEIMEQYFKSVAEIPAVKHRHWIQFNHGFSLVLQKKTDEAKIILFALSAEVKDPILGVLTLYMLDLCSGSDEKMNSFVKEGKKIITERYNRDAWNKLLEKQRDNIQLVIMSKLINDAADWMYAA